jgi:hypothetical protein
MASGEDTSAENEKDENFLPPLDKHPTTAIVVIFSSWLEPTPGRFRPRMAVRSETKAVNGYDKLRSSVHVITKKSLNKKKKNKENRNGNSYHAGHFGCIYCSAYL